MSEVAYYYTVARLLGEQPSQGSRRKPLGSVNGCSCSASASGHVRLELLEATGL